MSGLGLGLGLGIRVRISRDPYVRRLFYSSLDIAQLEVNLFGEGKKPSFVEETRPFKA